MLVVLADYSDDDGNSYPAVASLARKCRMTPRNANYILGALQSSGELRVLKNEGPKGTNRYRIMLSKLGEPRSTEETTALKRTSPLKAASPPEDAFTLKPTSAPPEAGFPMPLKPASDEPSLNRQEPSRKATSSPTVLPVCPFNEVLKIYNESLPSEAVPWPPAAAQRLSEERKRAIYRVWLMLFTEARPNGAVRANNEGEALHWFRRYFATAWENDHWAGRTQRGAGHEKWRCSIDHLLKETQVTRVIES